MAEFICRKCGNNQLQNAAGTVISGPKAIDVNSQYFCTVCGEELPKEQMSELIQMSVQESLVGSNLRLQALEAQKNGDYETASNLYQQLQILKPNDWAPVFYSVYCNCYNAVGAVENACKALEQCLNGVFDKIDNLQGEERVIALKQMLADTGLFALHMFDSAVQRHASLDASTMTQHNAALKSELISALNIMIACVNQMTKRYGDDDQAVAQVTIPATCALKMQSRQPYVSLVMQAETARTLLELVRRFDPAWAEEYIKKQNRAMASGTIFLMILGAIFLPLGLYLKGAFAKPFCLIMAAGCLFIGVVRIIVQLANKKLNG